MMIMKQKNFFHELKDILKQNEKFIAENGQILQAKVHASAMAMDKELLKLLLENESTREHFFTEIEGNYVFDKTKFVWVLESRELLEDSYTSYKNKIGLTDSQDNLISQKDDVSLVWPYKDCVLAGGQTKDEQKREEIFYNETLAPDEVNQLLHPKVFTNAKKYTKEGERKIDRVEDADNLIIKGNNLLALHSLKERYAGKVKLIYIDPPYNTGNDSFRYNDRFNRSTWLTFMKNRLKVAKWLLRDDGVIYVHCDDNQQAYLKVLMDEIFGEENFITTICYQGMDTIKNDAKFFSSNHEFILCYAQDKNSTTILGRKRTEEHNKVYKNYDNDPRGRYLLTPLHAKSGSKAGIYTYTFKNGISWTPPNGTYPRFSKETLRKLEEDNRIYFGSRENAIPQRKTFLSEVSQYVTLTTFWDYKLAGSTRNSRSEIKSLELDELFDTPKPEKLLQLIIESCTKKGDLVLDFFMGSGTTQAVAHKLERQYIGIEQMEYINTVSVPRLQKVVQGEQGGITKDVD